MKKFMRLKMIIGLLVAFYLLTASFVSAESITNATSEGKDYFQEHLYEVFYNPETTWHNGRDHCESLGGHLVTISSEEEDDFLTSFLLGIIPTDSLGAYIGLSDAAVEGVWEWVTGEPVVYTNWDFQEPFGNGDYVHKWMYNGPVDEQGAWNDISANRMDYYICEWEIMCAPEAEWKNHGHYVRCVSHEVERLVSEGIITQEEGDAMVSAAAQSDVGK